MSLYFKAWCLQLVSVVTQRAPMEWHSDFIFLSRRRKYFLYSLAPAHHYVDKLELKDTRNTNFSAGEILCRIQLKSPQQLSFYKALLEHSIRSPFPESPEVVPRFAFQIVQGSDREDWLISSGCDCLARLVNGRERERRVLTVQGQYLIREYLAESGLS